MINPGLVKLAADFDKARAFELGFAKAAAEYGLSAPEYQEMCKIAADFSVADTAGSPTGAAFRAQMAAQAGSAGKEATKNDKFLADRKSQVVGKAPPAVAAKATPKADPFAFNPYSSK